LKILILGAAGQVSVLLRKLVLEETNHELVLYGRRVSQRLSLVDPARETMIDGDFMDQEALKCAMKSVDMVYLNDMNDPDATKTIVEIMKQTDTSFIIGANILGIYGEVVGAFGKWNAQMVGETSTKRHLAAANVVEQSSLNYVILRLTWLYNQAGNERYELSQKGNPFIGAQVTREAVARLIMDILKNPQLFVGTNIGVSEPNTDWSKPAFY